MELLDSGGRRCSMEGEVLCQARHGLTRVARGLEPEARSILKGTLLYWSAGSAMLTGTVQC
jgi:hypothetical protein